MSITSTGEYLDGVFVAAGSYTLQRPVISPIGNDHSDLCGYGAAVVGDGSGTTLVLNDASTLRRQSPACCFALPNTSAGRSLHTAQPVRLVW
ncbi:hypothetical protein [Streptomyces carpinensis]|uniref:Uncharacterized protein n=1 Tax=Streptomyces carpinensis TaxID=66369 RepID=A0ABV1VXP6_9ACTN|nr:hypothetical protein [Streptomyces carpinensis]